MSFTALLGDKIINLLRDNPQDYRDANCVCKFCGESMIVVIGEVIRSHFRHHESAKCSHESEPESKEHLDLKAFIAGIYFESELEKLIKTGGKKYEIDVLLDNKYAIECQVSACGNEYVAEKTKAYLDAGFVPVWIFYARKPYSKNEPSRLANILRECFLSFGKFYGNVYPLSFLYLEKEEQIVKPVFIQKKIADDFSPVGYHNEYYLGSNTVRIEQNDFIDYLRKNTRNLSAPCPESRIKNINFYFLQSRFPCYEFEAEFENGQLYTQRLYENEWGIKQLEMYGGVKLKDNCFFDANILFMVKENIKNLIGEKAILKTLVGNKQYLSCVRHFNKIHNSS